MKNNEITTIMNKAANLLSNYVIIDIISEINRHQ